MRPDAASDARQPRILLDYWISTVRIGGVRREKNFAEWSDS
jgi:hypothetical protein